jgi:hypothetical protein
MLMYHLFLQVFFCLNLTPCMTKLRVWVLCLQMTMIFFIFKKKKINTLFVILVIIIYLKPKVVINW